MLNANFENISLIHYIVKIIFSIVIDNKKKYIILLSLIISNKILQNDIIQDDKI